jgi:multidrug efflux system membrane fusion protein
VFIVAADNTVQMRQVSEGIVYGEQTIVESGLSPGEVVVTDGQLRLVPGASVKIVAPTTVPATTDTLSSQEGAGAAGDAPSGSAREAARPTTSSGNAQP